MTPKHVSLSELSDRLLCYERLPVPVSQTIQDNLGRAGIVSGIAVAFFALGPRLLTLFAWSGLFVPWGVVDWPAMIASYLAQMAQTLSPILLPLNIAGLAVIGYLFWRSKGFSKPVEEIFHWLAGGAMVVAAISILSTTFITVGYLTAIAFALALWIVITALIILAICLCLGALAVFAAASAG